ncbi:phosphofurin acidic cluster sorting protein 2-like [Bolinopsis microptera]|uniref:phosphofurin acidic cluster sorting protein 2-like n=1 Tax=Bolinopsis microptera TaxID=2820187 RepID=UPI00307AF243
MENYSKPLSMKLFSTWEGERTAPHCIPRTCTFKLLEVKLAKPFDTEISSVTICASMSVGNFRRSLRTDEIYLNNGLAELDYCFSFQYPHYLKREEKHIKAEIFKGKRFQKKTILGKF